MAYRQVIDFIFEAYKNIPEKESVKLYMIVSGGSKKEIDLLQQEVNNQFDVPKIKLFSDIPYKQLVHLYVNAKALLIPLRPNAQDSARFPHKIGEYLASGNPIITTNVGEIKNYFEDGKTALIADTYDVCAFARKMKYVLDFPEESKDIGLNGKELGLKEFNYKMHGSRLQKFLREF
jgi:glycosyltransferase involved in cell wall biosynthesis